MTSPKTVNLDQVLRESSARLLALRGIHGHWEGHLSSSALATATAVVALDTVDSERHREFVAKGVAWLLAHQNEDGGWGDTPLSRSNFSTTLLVVGALTRCGTAQTLAVMQSAWRWLEDAAGGRDANDLVRATIARYGKDRTFSVPILMHSAICGVLGVGYLGWRHVLPLPFELAALPRRWFGAIGLPVVSYALPALIAIGHARFRNAPPHWLNPVRWIRAALWKARVRPLLGLLQPSSGGYLEATPLTSFVAMALAASGEMGHPCLTGAVQFLRNSMRSDGSWPIDTNLATWGTSLAVKSGISLDQDARIAIKQWLVGQQYQKEHPFTNAAPGGWAWTDLPGGVPDADDTPGAMLALERLQSGEPEVLAAACLGSRWLLDLQNRDGGIPTFCRGWGTLPFDRSAPELTAHCLAAWWTWRNRLPQALALLIERRTARALGYLRQVQRSDGAWVPLWFGHEFHSNDENPIYGTAQVVSYLCETQELAALSGQLIEDGITYLVHQQQGRGGWSSCVNGAPTIEETSVAVSALLKAAKRGWRGGLPSAQRGVQWLAEWTEAGTKFPASPIGLYFAKLWYSEDLYPLIWTVEAFGLAKAQWENGEE